MGTGDNVVLNCDDFTFKVQKAPIEDIGRDRVRLHWKRRLGKKRFVILQLEHSGQSALVSALGHEGGEDIIQMDIDLRDKLKLEPGDEAKIRVSLATWWQQLEWYFTATDPAVRIPALLGAWSFAIGLVSILPIYEWILGAVRYAASLC